jgi:DNA-binding response OmpR family regulator
MKVLLVDNDWRFVQQATSYLESRAHDVVHQPHAKDALAKAEHWQPDLVVMSAETAQKGVLAGLTKMKDRPAILLTGYLDQYHVVWQTWQQGGDDVLIKPVMSGQEFHVAIVTALENHVAGAHKPRTKSRASA